MKTIIIAQRLKELRAKAELTQEELAEKLCEQQNISITTATIKKYETSNANKLNQIQGMRIEFLNAFADFYGVSTDYILGRTSSTSTDVTEQIIYENFGLVAGSLSTLKYLNTLKKKDIEKIYCGVPPMLALNKLLSTVINGFLINTFKYYMEKEKYSQDISEHYNLSDERKQKLENSYNDINRYFAISAMENFINEFYDRFTEYRQAQKIKNSPQFQEFSNNPENIKRRKETAERIKKMREGISYGKKD